MFGNNEKFLKIFGSNDNLKGNIMNDVINNKNNDRDFLETSIRETELVEEFLDVNDYESNSLIRMEMNVIEFPIFSKNPRVKKNQILKYYFSKDKKEFLEITPPPNESIPNEFDERIFISLLKVMKKKGNKSVFYCTATEIADGLNVSKGTKRGLYGKIKTSVLKLSKTNYSFANLFYAGEFSSRINDLINTPLLTSRIITFKDADSEEKNLFKDKRIKEFYRIRISDDIYNNITNKGYLVFDADVLLNIGDPIVRSLYTQITKWRFNELYLKKPLVYIAKKIPLSLKGRMIYKTVEKINESFNELKKLGLITDFNYIVGDKIEKGFFEIFFSFEHNKVKQRLFYKDKEDYNNLIHSVEERLNEVYFNENNSTAITEIINIFGIKGQALKTLPSVIKEALIKYDYEYVFYSAEYTVYNAKVSILKYFKETLANNWADEYIAKQKLKKEKNKKKEIEEAVIIEQIESDIKTFFSWEDFQKLSIEKQEEITQIAYKNFIMDSGGVDNNINRNIFEKTKKGLILALEKNCLEIIENENKSEKLLEVIKNQEECKTKNDYLNEKIVSLKDNLLSEKKYPSISKFCIEFYKEAKKYDSEISLEEIMTSIKILGEYVDENFIAKYDIENNYGGYKKII